MCRSYKHRWITVFSLGEAQAVLAKAEAKAKAICMLSDALTQQVNMFFSFCSVTVISLCKWVFWG